MTTLNEAKKLLESVERNEYNKKPYDAAKALISLVENEWKDERMLILMDDYIRDCKRLDDSALKISELKSYDREDKIHEVAQTIKKSRAEAAKKRREKQVLIQFVATPKAEENLKELCESTGLNKTQVINKLLEEQRIEKQLSLIDVSDHPFDD